MEVYVKTPLKICKGRDPKGLYRKAKMSKTIDFTGIDSKYEIPQKADINIDTSTKSEQEIGDYLIQQLKHLKVIL